MHADNRFPLVIWELVRKPRLSKRRGFFFWGRIAPAVDRPPQKLRTSEMELLDEELTACVRWYGKNAELL